VSLDLLVTARVKDYTQSIIPLRLAERKSAREYPACRTWCHVSCGNQRLTFHHSHLLTSNLHRALILHISHVYRPQTDMGSRTGQGCQGRLAPVLCPRYGRAHQAQIPVSLAPIVCPRRRPPYVLCAQATRTNIGR